MPSTDPDDPKQENHYGVNGFRRKKKAKSGTVTTEYATGLATAVAKGAGDPISYIQGPQILGFEKGGEFFYFLTDALGSVRDICSGTDGAVLQSYDYSENGDKTTVNGTGPQSAKTWVGGYSVNDDVGDSGLYLMGHRHYDPSTARFLSRDPSGFAGGMNLYSYGNSPVTTVDPAGLENLSPVVAPGPPVPESVGGPSSKSQFLATATWTALMFTNPPIRIASMIDRAVRGEPFDPVRDSFAHGSTGVRGASASKTSSEPCPGGGGGSVNLYHGSRNFSGEQFDLDLAVRGQRAGTPIPGVYLTDDFTRAAVGYGKGGQVVRTTVSKEFAQSIKNMGGPRGNSPEFIARTNEQVDMLNNASLIKLATNEATKLWTQGKF